MKPIQLLSVLSLAVVLAVGCQQTTTTSSTGPAVPNEKNGDPAVKQLTLTAAAHQTIRQGGIDQMSVKIARKNFDAPVTIRVLALPKGVGSPAEEIVIPAGKTTARLKLTAEEDAVLGDHEIEIDAQAPGLDDNIQTVKLTVREKELELPVSTPF